MTTKTFLVIFLYMPSYLIIKVVVVSSSSAICYSSFLYLSFLRKQESRNKNKKTRNNNQTLKIQKLLNT